jgi:hypothetical protein
MTSSNQPDSQEVNKTTNSVDITSQQVNKADSQAGDELVTANFGKWIELNGVKLGDPSEKPFFGFVNSSVDLNTLKASVMAYAERLATKARIDEWEQFDKWGEKNAKDGEDIIAYIKNRIDTLSVTLTKEAKDE